MIGMKAKRLQHDMKRDVPGSILMKKDAMFDPILEKWVVTKHDDETVTVTREKEIMVIDRKTLQVVSGTLPKSELRYTAVWTTGLPSITEKELAKFYAMIDGLGYDEGLFLLDLDDEVGGAYAIIDSDGNAAKDHRGQPMRLKLPKPPKTGLKSMCMCISSVEKTGVEEAVMHVKEHEHVGFTQKARKVYELSAWQNLNDETSIMKGSLWPISTSDQIEDQWHYMLSAYEEDRLICLACVEPGDPMSQNTVLTVMASEGRKLYHVDAIDDHFYGENIEPGIHVGENATWFDAWEDGAELEVDWRPATKKDIESFGLSVVDLESAIETLTNETDPIKARKIYDMLPNE